MDLYYGYDLIRSQVLLGVYNVPGSIPGMELGLKLKKSPSLIRERDNK